MIVADQPDCFDDHLLVSVSSASDGTMLDRSRGTHHPSVVTNRVQFCHSQAVDYQSVVYQKITYDDTQHYDKLVAIDKPDITRHQPEVAADGVILDKPGVGVLLPIADCVATVIYDPVLHRAALLHLGRHSTVAGLAKKTISRLIEQGSQPENLVVWMAPSVQKEHYRLDYFTAATQPDWQPFCEQRHDGIYIDMQGYNRQAFLENDVPESSIYISSIDTATNDNYFSHSQGDIHSRFAVLVMLR